MVVETAAVVGTVVIVVHVVVKTVRPHRGRGGVEFVALVVIVVVVVEVVVGGDGVGCVAVGVVVQLCVVVDGSRTRREPRRQRERGEEG